MGSKNRLERRVCQFYTICDKNQLIKLKKKWESYGKFGTQMAGFQLLGPAADVYQNLYGKISQIVWGAQAYITITPVPHNPPLSRSDMLFIST